jgi:hypothetical protein
VGHYTSKPGHLRFKFEFLCRENILRVGHTRTNQQQRGNGKREPSMHAHSASSVSHAGTQTKQQNGCPVPDPGAAVTTSKLYAYFQPIAALQLQQTDLLEL